MLTELLSVPWFFDLRLPYQLRWNYVTDHKEWFIDGLILAIWKKKPLRSRRRYSEASNG